MTKETKMETASPTDLSREMHVAFEALKAANDARLEEIEKRGSPDPLLDEKVARIDTTLDNYGKALERIELRQSRPGLGEAAAPANNEEKSAWHSYMRSGESSRFHRSGTKALSGGAADEGSVVVPPELDRLIEAQLTRSSVMRQIATVRQTSAMTFEKPVSDGTTVANWVAETAGRATTANAKITLLRFPAIDLYAAPAATQALLDDAYVDIDEWLAEEIETAFATKENEAFINGSGTDQPTGILTYPNALDSVTPFPAGTIGTVASGRAGGFPQTGGVDPLINLVYALDAQFRANGRFVMNRRSVSAVRRLKDSNGTYLWQIGADGGASTLLGYPVTEFEDMPDIADGSTSIAFGDFRKAYLIVDRQGVQVLRDPYSSKPLVLFYTTKRVGGGVQNFQALKLMTF